ncbi:MAG TPA: TlpA disulfide reductase family protein [Ktedonobacterales bacterium]|nr:TlpA disulfide reductase family protein [Ktedonobacterales bacterium]
MLEETSQAKTPPAKAPSRKRRAIATLIFFTALNIVLVAVLWSRLATAQHIISGAATIPLVGHAAPDFTLTPWESASGQTIRLSSLKGKPVILNFWASWCTPCNAETPLLQTTWQQYRADGVAFIGIDYQDQQQEAQQFLQKYHVTYPTGPDASGSISVDFGVSNVPATVFIDRSGVVVRQVLGPVNAKMLDAEIQQLLK